MIIACEICVGRLASAGVKRRQANVNIRLSSPIGTAQLGGSIVLDFRSIVPDCYVEKLRKTLSVSDTFVTDVLICAFGAYGNAHLLRSGEVYVRMTDITDWLDEWYVPYAAEQKRRTIEHALRNTTEKRSSDPTP